MAPRQGPRELLAVLEMIEVLAVRQEIEHEDFHGRQVCYNRSASRKETAMATDSGYTLDQCLADTRATIKVKGVPSGLAEIRDHLEKLLRNTELLKKHLGDPVPYRERTTIGHDPETDVHVLVHGREKGGKSVPHDHGPCWVIYGNYKNPTCMR